MQSINLSLILPVHNEASLIESTLQEIKKCLDESKISYEIICVENGSTDTTWNILKRIAVKNKNIYITQSDKGWGNAVKKGISKAQGRYICYMVSDGQISPSTILKLYEKIKENPASLIKIYRINRENRFRLVNSKVYNILSQLFFGLNAHDVNASPKMISNKNISSLNFLSTNVSFDLELLLKLRKKKITWIEIPVSTIKRKKGISSTNINSVREMLYFMALFLFKGV